jgi:type IV pilus assembly protein PilN
VVVMKLNLNLVGRHHVLTRRIRPCLKISLLLLLVLSAYQGHQLIVLYGQIGTHQAAVTELQRELGMFPAPVDPIDLTAAYQEYDRARELLLRDSFRWTELFDRMEGLLPEGIGLRSFQPDYRADSLRIDGVARDLQHLQALLDNLLQAEFSQVYLRQQSRSAISDGSGGSRYALNFSIELMGVFP